MARRRYTKKRSTRKKSVKQRRAFGNSKLNVPKNLVDFGMGFPKKVMMKLKYTDTIILTSTAGVPAHYKFKLNGLFDTNNTGVGHQPMYFDQIMAIYDHYHVIGAKMRVDFLPYESNVIGMNCVVWQNDDGAHAGTTISEFQEATKAKNCLIGSDGGSTKTLDLSWSAKKCFGGSILGNDELRGTASSDPTEATFGQITVASADNLTTTNVVARVWIEYVAIFTELKDIAGS